MALRYSHMDQTEGNPIGRYLVRVWGDGFSVPRSLPGPGDPEETMRVYVNGTLSELVEVFTPQSLQFLMPTYVGNPDLLPLNADVRIDNIDPETGAVLESVTATGAFKLRLTPLTSDSRILAVLKEMIVQFRRHVLANTVHLTNTDYADEGGGIFSVIPAEQQLPMIVLAGPVPVEDNLYREGYGKTRERGGGQWVRQSPPLFVALVFTLTGASDNRSELVNLMALVARYFSSVQEFNLWYAGEQEVLDLEVVEPPKFVTDDGSGNNYATFNATFRVRGFELRDDDRVAAARGWTVLDDELTVERKETP